MGKTDHHSRRILPILVLSQFFCTSLWFAGNAVIPDLADTFAFSPSALAHFASAVQLGFISGTLCYAVFMVADRFSPSKVFCCSAIAAAAANLGVGLVEQSLGQILLMRFLTGFFLAGIYPVGMKIAADYYDQGLGRALGYLVGALVVGTALPHLLQSFSAALPYQTVLGITSVLSLVGGALILLLVPDGPYRKKSPRIKAKVFFKVFRDRAFRAASVGYFGHMWELYTFWAFVPILLATYLEVHPGVQLNVPLLSFLIIAGGSLACVGSGYFSQKFGAGRTAFVCLGLSGLCCLLSPLAFWLPPGMFIAFLVFWGLVVIADSPMFSTLVAQFAPAKSKGTALTFVTCIGFLTTIVSIEFVSALLRVVGDRYMYLFLVLGPIAGLILMMQAGIHRQSRLPAEPEQA